MNEELSVEHKKLLEEFLKRPNGKEEFVKEMKRRYEQILRLEISLMKSN